MTPRKTAKGQTLLELSQEFIGNLKKNESGSRDMDLFFDRALEMETRPATPAMLDTIHNVAKTGFDAMSIPFIQNCKPNVSEVLLSWICTQSMGIPEYITTMLGFYCTAFYATHSKTEKLTLRWVGEQVGKGKLLNFRQFFPYAAVAKDETGVNMFDTMTPEELYIA